MEEVKKDTWLDKAARLFMIISAISTTLLGFFMIYEFVPEKWQWPVFWWYVVLLISVIFGTAAIGEMSRLSKEKNGQEE